MSTSREVYGGRSSRRLVHLSKFILFECEQLKDSIGLFGCKHKCQCLIIRPDKLPARTAISAFSIAAVAA